MRLTGGGEFTDVERLPRCTYGCFINSESKREMCFSGLVHSKIKMLSVSAHPVLMLLTPNKQKGTFFKNTNLFLAELENRNTMKLLTVKAVHRSYPSICPTQNITLY